VLERWHNAVLPVGELEQRVYRPRVTLACLAITHYHQLSRHNRRTVHAGWQRQRIVMKTVQRTVVSYEFLSRGSVTQWWFHTCLKCIRIVVSEGRGAVTGGLRGWSQCYWQTQCGGTDCSLVSEHGCDDRHAWLPHPHAPNHYCYTLQVWIETTILLHNPLAIRRTCDYI